MDTMRLEVTGAVARLTLDRPHVLNAGNRRWVADLNEAVRRLAALPDVRVVVITGAGRAFSTGVDLKELAAGQFESRRHRRALSRAAPTSVRASKLLTARAFDMDLEAFRAEMQAHFEACLASEDHRRAMAALQARSRA